MLLIPTISRTAETEPALDQRQLYAIGLDHVRRLSRRLWTDHNIHDPGITTLELLCYALTDLGYRAQFPVEDLLAGKTDNAAAMAGQFFTPRQILPNRALTRNDYRKLLIDLKDVKNAWLAPATERYYADTIKGVLLRSDPGVPGIREIDLKGLYQVLVEFDESVTTDARRAEIKAAALTLLQANRNLCEDFVGIDEVQDQYYTLCAELELEPAADQAQVAARVQFDVEQYLTPQVLNYSLSDMLAHQHADGTPYSVAEIFEGPLLQHGFIDDGELAAAKLRSEIRLSDIIAIIMDIPGVRAVRDIIINPLSPGDQPSGTPLAPANKWLLPVPAGKQPRLSATQGRLVFYKRNMPVMADPAQLKSKLQALYDAQESRLDTVLAEDLPIPLGRFRNTDAYQSFQHHFPVLYGLSEQGLPAGADAQRQALALQLKAYLLFIDQVMANYFAQLAGLGDLFSRDPAITQTYHAQVVDSFPAALKIYVPGISADDLQGLLEDDAAALARRNRFLDHLLARFAEDFHHYVSIMDSAFGAGAQSAVEAKCAFLDDYPQIGAERALAYNYSLTSPADLWNSLNVSGLERRLARLLGIVDFSRRNLGAVSYDMYTQIDKTPGDEYRFRINDPVSGKILLSSSTNYATPALALAEMTLAIDMAQRSEGYQRKVTIDGKQYFNIINGKGEVIARRIEYFATADLMNAAIDALIAHLCQYYSGEGMYLLENILLRPGQPADPFMPICVDPACTDCADDDPYSYRLNIVLPAYAGRFQNMDFRRYVEETIRFEMPAHILPKICWIDVADMARLEQAYRDWISLRAGVTMANRSAKLQAFIDALYSIKNVYPTQKLHNCGCDPAKPPFVLDRTALGSETTVVPNVKPTIIATRPKE
jgi:hypothetical protein